MRKILFKGKRTDNGEWACGSYVNTDYGHTNKIVDRWEGDEYDVDPATVGQFTGISADDNTGIFEGDIVNFTLRHFKKPGTHHTCPVVYIGPIPMLRQEPDAERGLDGERKGIKRVLAINIYHRRYGRGIQSIV